MAHLITTHTSEPPALVRGRIRSHSLSDSTRIWRAAAEARKKPSIAAWFAAAQDSENT